MTPRQYTMQKAVLAILIAAASSSAYADWRVEVEKLLAVPVHESRLPASNIDIDLPGAVEHHGAVTDPAPRNSGGARRSFDDILTPPLTVTRQYLVPSSLIEDTFPDKKRLINQHEFKLQSISETETVEDVRGKANEDEEERRKKKDEKFKCSSEVVGQFIENLLDEMGRQQNTRIATLKALQDTCKNIPMTCEYKGYSLEFHFNIDDESVTITPGFEAQFGPHLPHLKHKFEGPSLQVVSSSSQLSQGNVCSHLPATF